MGATSHSTSPPRREKPLAKLRQRQNLSYFPPAEAIPLTGEWDHGVMHVL